MKNLSKGSTLIGVIILIVIVGIGFLVFKNQSVPAGTDTVSEQAKADESMKMEAQISDADSITGDVESLGDINVQTNLDLSN